MENIEGPVRIKCDVPPAGPSMSTREITGRDAHDDATALRLLAVLHPGDVKK